MRATVVRTASPLVLSIFAAITLASILSRRRLRTGVTALYARDEDKNSSTNHVERMLTVYKRTFVSLDPFYDGEFLRSTLGMSATTSQLVMMPNDSGENVTCAEREVLTTLDNFQLHFFHSYKYPMRRQAATWLKRWASGHRNLSLSNWDVFAAPSVTLYSPWIKPFVQRLSDEDVRHLRYYQIHEGGTIVYSIVLNIPNTGLTIEVISDQSLWSSDQNMHDSFLPQTGRMCPHSLQIHQDPKELRLMHARLGGKLENDRGLPDLLLVSLYFPATIPSRFEHFFSAVFGSLGIHPFSRNIADTTCDVWAVQVANTVTMNGTVITNPIFLKAIANNIAQPASTNYTLDQFEADVESSHKEFMTAPNEGWDAYIDMHPGLHINKNLDGLPETLKDLGYDYTMHPRCFGCTAGSIWATGLNPWAIEIQGAFDQGDEIKLQSLIDYCSATSNGDTRENINIINRRSAL